MATEHVVQLFDEPESRAEGVAAFLYQGFCSGAPLLVVAQPENWTLMSAQLEALGCDVADTIAKGRLTVLDARTTLATVMVGERPDPKRYAENVVAAVRRASVLGRPFIYGEMVDVLAGQGLLEAACELEVLWNQLGEQESFTLLCGYTSAHFGDPRDASALHRICRAHSRAEAPATDLFGTWLLNNRKSQYHTT